MGNMIPLELNQDICRIKVGNGASDPVPAFAISFFAWYLECLFDLTNLEKFYINRMFNFVRILQILFLSVVCLVEVNAFQSNCQLQLSGLPEIHEFMGLKLGLTIEGVRVLVPDIKVPPADEFGLVKTSFSPDFSTKIDKKAFPSIRTVSLEFVDGRLASIWMGFNETFKWQTIDAAITGLSTELHLPAGWQAKSREQQLVCGDFHLGVSLVSNSPSIRIINDAAKQLWQGRREAKAEAEP